MVASRDGARDGGPGGRPAVLYVDNSFTFGGAINTLADVLAELQARVEPVVVSGQSEAVLRGRFGGVPTYHVKVRVPWERGIVARSLADIPGLRRGPGRRVVEGVRGLYWVVRYHLPRALRLWRIGRRHGVDLVHLNNTAESQLGGLLAARLLGVPCVAHARGQQHPSPASRRYAALADLHVAVSRTIAENLRRMVPDEAVVVVPDGIDVDRFLPGPAPDLLREELAIPAGAPVFGIFGRLVPWKGIQEFVTAAARVIGAVPEARAIVVGDPSDGDARYVEGVKALVRDAGLADRILFTGYRDDVPDLMRLCDVIVHASLVPEPFGLVVVEAMAVGRPVVAANSGGPVQIVVPGETGVLVDPRDSEALAEAVTGLLRDPERRARLGRAGAERARSRYAARISAERLWEVYQPLLAGRGSAGGGDA